MSQEQTPTPETPPVGLNLVVQVKGMGFNWVLRDGETPKCEGLKICQSLTLAAQDALQCGIHICESLASQYLEVLDIQEQQQKLMAAQNHALECDATPEDEEEEEEEEDEPKFDS